MDGLIISDADLRGRSEEALEILAFKPHFPPLSEASRVKAGMKLVRVLARKGKIDELEKIVHRKDVHECVRKLASEELAELKSFGICRHEDEPACRMLRPRNSRGNGQGPKTRPKRRYA